MDPIINAIGLILIAAFLIDWIISGFFFLMSFSVRWRKMMPDPALITDPEGRASATRKQKLIYSIIAGTLGTVVIAGYLEIRLLALMGLVKMNSVTNSFEHPLLDTLLTGLIFMGGADQIADALKMIGGASVYEKSASKPIEITGKLVLEERPTKTDTVR